MGNPIQKSNKDCEKTGRIRRKLRNTTKWKLRFPLENSDWKIRGKNALNGGYTWGNHRYRFPISDL
jgi:hypothetical protein